MKLLRLQGIITFYPSYPDRRKPQPQFYASRLEAAEIKSVPRLANSSAVKVASTAKVNKKEAEKWVRSNYRYF
ncbi:MAG: hypothetical protein KIH01_01235 [Candidatus Freyarchaeota archaeon]|nr:hypothetical protein [Candidatus Jordarchaeia archaeon]